MTVTTEQTVDLDAVEHDANEKIGELGAQRQRLALDAISDPDVRSELEAVESELVSAEAELARVALARAEAERRDAERQRQERNEHQAAALSEARRLQGKREVAARAVDKHAAALMTAVAEHCAIATDQQRWLTEAGRAHSSFSVAPRAFALEAAIAFQMRKVALPNDFLQRFPVVGAHAAPLADADVRAVEKE